MAEMTLKCHIESEQGLKRSLRISFPEQDFQAALGLAFHRLKAKVQLKGFRPGKVPAAVVEKHYGASLRQDTLSDLVEKSIKQALEEQHWDCVGSPKIRDLSMKSGEDIHYIADLELFPTFPLRPFSEYSYVEQECVLTPEDIQAEILEWQKRLGEYVPVDRAVDWGDKLVLNVKSVINGQEADHQENAFLIVDSERSLAALNHAVLGKNVGDFIEVDTVYPEDWAEITRRGQTLHIEATIKAISEHKLCAPERLWEMTGGEERFKEYLQRSVQQQMDGLIFEKNKEQIMKMLLEDPHYASIPLPETLLGEEPSLEKQQEVRSGMILYRIMRERQIELKAEDLQKAVEAFCDQSPDRRKPEQCYRDQAFMQALEYQLLLGEVATLFLAEASVQKEKVSRSAFLKGND